MWLWRYAVTLDGMARFDKCNYRTWGQSTVVVSGNSLQNDLEPVNDEMKIISLFRFNNYIL